VNKTASGGRTGLGRPLLALAFGLTVSALLLEGLTLLVFGEQAKFPRHVVGAPWDLRYNEPLAHYRHKSADLTTYFDINREGMRANRDYDYVKPPGVRRVVSLGDSFTIGYEVDLDSCFSSVLEGELRAKGRNVEVLNAGVSGYSNAEEFLYLQRELIKYDPDVVLISFVTNDFVDNERSELLRLDGDRLVEWKHGYVPAGSLGDFLNTNVFFNYLSERSNAFALLKERATLLVKQRMVGANELAIEQAEASSLPGQAGNGGAGESSPYARRLTVAIFEALYDFTRKRGIPLVINSIPYQRREPTESFIETFPLADFDVGRPGLYFVGSADLLRPYIGKQLLVWERSHYHWTPFSHHVVGENLARLFLDNHLVD
jgi:hypothetical protein